MTLTELIEASKNGPVYIRQKNPRHVDGGALSGVIFYDLSACELPVQSSLWL